MMTIIGAIAGLLLGSGAGYFIGGGAPEAGHPDRLLGHARPAGP